MTYFLMIFLFLSPLVFGGAGYLLTLKKPQIREYFYIGITSLEMAAIIVLLFVNNGSVLSLPVLGMGLSFKMDAFRAIYSFISIFLWLMTVAFSKEYMLNYAHKDRYYMFYMFTLSGVVGVFMSNDLFTTFVFFEIMSIASYPLVIHDEKDESMEAGVVYLAIAIITGMILLMGLFMAYSVIGSLTFTDIKAYVNNNGVPSMLYAAGILMLLGFGAKAGMYPLHIWLPKAHPVAPAPASALLSGILTKTGVFGIIVISANIFYYEPIFADLLLALAVITMFLGALLALFSTNLKRTLACSSMSQIGFILVGISFYLLLSIHGENGIAIYGSLLHMMNHSLIKLVLFMAAGVVAMNIHKLDLNEIQGYGRKKYFLMAVFLIGSLGIMGVPFFNGYVSKTMIHEAITEYISYLAYNKESTVIFKIVEWIFLISGGMTVAYMTKLFVCLFIKKNSNEALQKAYDNQKFYMSALTKAVFVLSTVAIPVIGILPNIVGVNLTNLTSDFFYTEKISKVSFFGWECLKGGLISIAIGVLIYFTVVRLLLEKNHRYADLWPKKLDLVTLVYRPFINLFLLVFLNLFYAVSLLLDGFIYLLRKTILKPVAYKFNPEPISYKIGAMIDKRRNTSVYAHKFEHDFNIMKNSILETMSSFSFALGTACVGLILIITFIFLI